MTHERTAPHNTDGPARTAAAAAQDRADDAYRVSRWKSGLQRCAAAAAAGSRGGTGRSPTIPIRFQRRNSSTSSNAHEDIVNVLDGRLARPAGRDAVWGGRKGMNLSLSTSPGHRLQLEEASTGTSDGLSRAAIPAQSSIRTRRCSWESGWPAILTLWRSSGGGAQFGDAATAYPRRRQGGRHPGVYLVSTARLRAARRNDFFRITITGPRLVTESDLADAYQRSRCPPHAAGRRRRRRRCGASSQYSCNPVPTLGDAGGRSTRSH